MTDGPARSDEELVRLVRVGDGDAARELFDRHAESLSRLARRRVVGGLRRKLGASDVVQETLLAAFQTLDGFEDRGPGSFRAWLERILDCRAKDQVKRHVVAGRRSVRREQSRASGVLDDHERASTASPSSVASHREETDALARALAAMEGDDRRVLELVRDHGKDFAVVGRAMERSSDAARKLYARAVVRLGRRVRRTS